MLLQSLWEYVLGHISLLQSPFFPVLFSLSIYLTFCLPFILLDLLSSRVALIQRYKIQPKSTVSWDTVKRCLGLTLYNHLVYIFPVTVLHWYWRPVSLPEQAPGVLSVFGGLIACLLLFDFQYFVWHLLHHKVPWLYRTFHKVGTFSMLHCYELTCACPFSMSILKQCL